MEFPYIQTKDLVKLTNLNTGQLNRLAKKAGMDVKFKNTEFRAIIVLDGMVLAQYICDKKSFYVNLPTKEFYSKLPKAYPAETEIIYELPKEDLNKIINLPGPEFIKIAQAHGVNWYEVDPENPISGKHFNYNFEKFIDPDDQEKYACDLNGFWFKKDAKITLSCSVRYKQFNEKVGKYGSLNYEVDYDGELTRFWPSVTVN